MEDAHDPRPLWRTDEKCLDEAMRMYRDGTQTAFGRFAKPVISTRHARTQTKAIRKVFKADPSILNLMNGPLDFVFFFRPTVCLSHRAPFGKSGLFRRAVDNNAISVYSWINCFRMAGTRLEFLCAVRSFFSGLLRWVFVEIVLGLQFF